MKTKLFLAINKRGTARVTRTRPNLNFDELEIGINLEIPDALFDKPRLEAQVTVPKEAIAQSEIQSKVADNIAEAVKAATGMPVRITLVPTGEDNNE